MPMANKILESNTNALITFLCHEGLIKNILGIIAIFICLYNSIGNGWTGDSGIKNGSYQRQMCCVNRTIKTVEEFCCICTKNTPVARIRPAHSHIIYHTQKTDFIECISAL